MEVLKTDSTYGHIDAMRRIVYASTVDKLITSKGTYIMTRPMIAAATIIQRTGLTAEIVSTVKDSLYDNSLWFNKTNNGGNYRIVFFDTDGWFTLFRQTRRQAQIEAAEFNKQGVAAFVEQYTDGDNDDGVYNWHIINKD